MPENLLVDKEDAIAVLTLNAPQSINSLSESMLEELTGALSSIALDRDIRVVILKSSSDNFCAGHNLKEMTARRVDQDGGYEYFEELFATCSKMMQLVVSMPQPVIAEVRGIATAAGCQLVAACDLAIAGETAKFATSGVNIGLFCSTPMVALSRNISPKHALEMLVTGEFITAKRAAEIGLINRGVPDRELSSRVRSLAEEISHKSGSAIRMGKDAFYKQLGMPIDKAYEYAGQTMARNMMTKDAEAGIKAFNKKRPIPPWSHE